MFPVSELRVVLLGSSWSQRSSVARLILGEDCFKDEAQCCLKISRKVNNMTITVINTPDLQFPTANKMTEFIKDFSRVSAPGPHVFLLVVKPEDFTMKEKNRICIILETFNEQSFDHLLLLILKPRQNISGLTLQIKEILAKCSNRYLKMEDIKQSELLTYLRKIVKQNNGEHVSYEEYEDAEFQSEKEKAATGSDDAATASGFGIVLLGKSEKNKAKLGNFILGGQEFHYQKCFPAKLCVVCCGEWSGKPFTVVKTPDMSKMSKE
ncbi:GTPase IMAP family member 8-like, partial [Cyprinodon tularosa]|uniref:GTPase IMAP family member 8-like n=1 Tax=Cyprinodon tularosa TaxID=77115 RepID=UPI0018E2558E